MHDLLAAQDIVKAAIFEAKKKNLKKITKLVIEMGEVIDHGEAISRENLEFNLKIVAQNTLAKNAQVVLKKIDEPQVRLVEIEGK